METSTSSIQTGTGILGRDVADLHVGKFGSDFIGLPRGCNFNKGLGGRDILDGADGSGAVVYCKNTDSIFGSGAVISTSRQIQVIRTWML